MTDSLIPEISTADFPSNMRRKAMLRVNFRRVNFDWLNEREKKKKSLIHLKQQT